MSRVTDRARGAQFAWSSEKVRWVTDRPWAMVVVLALVGLGIRHAWLSTQPLSCGRLALARQPGARQLQPVARGVGQLARAGRGEPLLCRVPVPVYAISGLLRRARHRLDVHREVSVLRPVRRAASRWRLAARARDHGPYQVGAADAGDSSWAPRTSCSSPTARCRSRSPRSSDVLRAHRLPADRAPALISLGVDHRAAARRRRGVRRAAGISVCAAHVRCTSSSSR